MGGIGGQGGWRQLAHNQLMSLQGLHFSPHSTIIKAQISGKFVSGGISDVAIASVYSEKIRLKKLMIMIITIITEKTFTSK